MRRARRGMTLMELVIGLAITGMMAAAGAGAFESIIGHREMIHDASLSTERAAALRDLLHVWIAAGTVQIPRGGGPRGLTRGLGTVAPARGAANSAMNSSAVAAAQASGDELSFTTSALNPSLVGSVRIRLYIDADDNTPERGLTMEYQANLQQPIKRRMLDSTIDTLKVEFLDSRTNRWLPSSEAATITNPVAVRLTLLPGTGHTAAPILELPMIFPLTQNGRRTFVN
jgi:prepilin-type N-terminal cleavage/methylation domain-containing protein